MARSRTHKKRRGGQGMVNNASQYAQNASNTASQYAQSASNNASQYAQSASNAASQYAQKAKQGLSSGFSSVSNWFSNLGKPAAPAPVVGGKRKHRFRTRKNKRGGDVVRAFNTYNDSFTMNTTPVSGYPTAMPHNWVGGKSRKNRGGKRASKKFRGLL
jgi:hypothetical protein